MSRSVIKKYVTARELTPKVDSQTTYYEPNVWEPITECRKRFSRKNKRKARKRRRIGRQYYLEAKANQPTETGVSDPIPPAAGRRNKWSGRPIYVSRLHGGIYTSPTTQACGLFPFVVGSGSPKIGVPIGPHTVFGETVSVDPLQWLENKLVTNPSIFVIGQPGIGKSAFVKRLVIGASGMGTIPLILGDVKPDYTGVIKALGGQVISLGRGRDKLNPLDAGPIADAAKRLRAAGHEADANRLVEEASGRRLALLIGICELGRKAPIDNYEEIMLASALDHFTRTEQPAPLLTDLVEVLRNPTEPMIDELNYPDAKEFIDDARSLVHTLSLMLRGSLKGIFDGPTTTQIDLEAKAIEIDISSIAGVDDEQGVSAAMLAVWSYAFSSVDAAIALSDAGLVVERNYFAILDELWRALRGAPGLVDRADAVTRVNRQRRMAVAMVTHSLDDLEALPTEADRNKAKGLIDRCGTVFVGAVPPIELDKLAKHVGGGLTTAEKSLISSWSAPADWSGNSQHPGMGRFLIKTGNRRGLPVYVSLTSQEIGLFETTHLANQGEE